MTDQQIIERIADFAGIPFRQRKTMVSDCCLSNYRMDTSTEGCPYYCRECGKICKLRQIKATGKLFNPLEDWNHTMQAVDAYMRKCGQMKFGIGLDETKSETEAYSGGTPIVSTPWTVIVGDRKATNEDMQMAICLAILNNPTDND